MWLKKDGKHCDSAFRFQTELVSGFSESTDLCCSNPDLSRLNKDLISKNGYFFSVLDSVERAHKHSEDLALDDALVLLVPIAR